MTTFPRNLAERYPTPFYAYDLEKAGSQTAFLRGLFPKEATTRLYYSFKSNPLPQLADAIRNSGAQADLTSTGEIEAAIAAGFDLSEALFGGPGKSLEEIETAIAKGVRQFSIESRHDYQIVGHAAASADVKVRGLLRINPAEPPKAKLAMSGVASQFGFEESELLDPSHQLPEGYDSHLSIEGIHIYWGTQVGGPDELAACFENAIGTSERIAKQIGFPLNVLNFGGGFPWPYAKQGEGPDLSPLRDKLTELHANAGAAKDAEWWFESGRFCSAASGTLVARVMDIKDSKDRRFVVLDTGIHHLGGMSGLGRIPRFAVDLEAPSERTGDEQKVDVVGQLCTPLDLLGRNQRLPDDLEIGDVVTIPNVGAYGATGSLTGFLSRPAPLEICYENETVKSVHQLRGGHEAVPSAQHHSAPGSATRPETLPTS